MDWKEIAADVIVALLPVLTTLLLALIGFGVAWVRQKWAWTKKSQTLAEVEELLRGIVIKTEETVTTKIKKAREDGKLTDEEAAKIREEVLLELHAQLTKGQRKVLEGLTEDLNKYLENKLDDMLAKYRVEKTMAVSDPVRILGESSTPSA